MDFKTYYLALSSAEKDKFSEQAGTSRGYLNQLAYSAKKIELGMADVFVAASDGAICIDELPLTDRAIAQKNIREKFKPEQEAA